MPIARRDSLLGGLLTMGWLLHPGCAAHAVRPDGRGLGCYVSRSEASQFFSRTRRAQAFARGDESIEPRSGDADLDYALAQALARMSASFEVLPGFAYFQGEFDDNAYATPEPRLQRTDGTVLFGLRMLREMLNLPEHRDAAIVAVCAHEFGHVVAFKTRLQETLVPAGASPFRGEQFADYMAGFFAGERRRGNPDYPAVVFATTLHGLGGTRRGSHGTREERGQAAAEGFKASYQDRLDLAAAIERGFRFAVSRS